MRAETVSTEESRHSIRYLDYAATAPMLPSVREKMQALMEITLGNASALHSAGHRAQCIIEQSRADVARLIHAEPEEIIFTSGGSEANNTAMHIFAGQRIAASNIEHPSVLQAAEYYAADFEPIPVDMTGRVDPRSVPRSVDLVSVMLANNELGTLEPIPDIARRLQHASPTGPRDQPQKPARKAYLHSDATQALGKIHIDVRQLGVDYLTLSAHKLGGPVGIGALYVRRGAPFTPLILGGHQESARRAGTSNTVAIAGFGEAARWCWEHWSCRKYQAIAKLRDQLAQRILAEIPYSSVNTPLDNALPNILNVSFQAAEGESIQLYLDAASIAVSTGSACAAGDIAPSHVLMATHHDAEIAHSSLRFSLGLDTTAADIDYIMQVLPDIIKCLQGMSTVKPTKPQIKSRIKPQKGKKMTQKTPQPTIVSQNAEKVNTNSANSTKTVNSANSAKSTNSADFAAFIPKTGPQDWVYTEIVKQHFLDPQNFLMGDEAAYAHDAEGVVGNPVCGDQMKMYLRITDDVIADIKWKTYGCASAIASTSALSELAKGKTLDQALAITAADIADYLGGLPAHKFHCSVLGHEALAAAIADYRRRTS